MRWGLGASSDLRNDLAESIQFGVCFGARKAFGVVFKHP